MATKGNRHNDTEQAISAPYNFVPLPEWIHIPDWGPLVSHDRPFRDGLSGTLRFTLHADTPLLVGGHQKAASDKAPGSVHPFRMGDDGPYAIPGSSLKGMLRSVIEIAGFGRMRLVDDQRLSIRDLTPGARRFYGDCMTETKGGAYHAKPQAGWLRFDAESGEPRVTPCEYARVEHDDLASLSHDDWWQAVPREPEAAKKYERWQKRAGSLTLRFRPGPKAAHDHSCGKLAYRKAESLGNGDTEGTIVFTGQPAARAPSKKGHKHMEFIFFDPAPEALAVSAPVWRDFRHIHAESKDWQWWRTQDAVPVFYLTDANGEVASMGLALMYRLAYDNSIHEAIAKTNEEHLALPGPSHGYDLADLLFGTVGEKQDNALRGRVTCEYAIAEGTPQLTGPKTTILNGPKPTFYPNYIQQNTDGNGRLKGNTYATFMDEKPVIRGFKRYPARPHDDAKPPRVGHDQKDNTKIQVRLHALEAGASFRGQIRFHNLKPVELGALLWAMTWGNREALRHSLGMGKPFGYGQTRLALDPTESAIHPNDPEQAPVTTDAATLTDYRRAFEEHMEAEHSRRGGAWVNSPQIANLLAMADPANAPRFEAQSGSELRHMNLGDGEFQKAKKARAVLPDYATAVGADMGQGARDASAAGAGYGHPWLDTTIPALMEAQKTSDDGEVLRGKALATRWSELPDDATREAVSEAIHALWMARGLFDIKPGKAMKQALRTYGWPTE